MSDIWEPWQPEIGQRVICKPSPECNRSPSGDTIGGRSGRKHSHVMERYGAMGQVFLVKDLASTPTGHRFGVEWDEWFRFPETGEECCGDAYAAIELELIQ